MFSQIDPMGFEHGNIEEDIVPYDDCIPDKFSDSFSNISPFFSSPEHLLIDTGDHPDLLLELSFWIDQHRPFLHMDRPEGISYSLKLESDRRDLDDRIMQGIESCGLEVEGDECR